MITPIQAVNNYNLSWYDVSKRPAKQKIIKTVNKKKGTVSFEKIFQKRLDIRV